MGSDLIIDFRRSANGVESLFLTFDILQDHTHVTYTATFKRLSTPEGDNTLCFKYLIRTTKNCAFQLATEDLF